MLFKVKVDERKYWEEKIYLVKADDMDKAIEMLVQEYERIGVKVGVDDTRYQNIIRRNSVEELPDLDVVLVHHCFYD